MTRDDVIAEALALGNPQYYIYTAYFRNGESYVGASKCGQQCKRIWTHDYFRVQELTDLKITVVKNLRDLPAMESHAIDQLRTRGVRLRNMRHGGGGIKHLVRVTDNHGANCVVDSLTDAASMIGCSRSTITRRCDAGGGLINGHKVKYFNVG